MCRSTIQSAGFHVSQADLVTADGSFDVQFDPGRQEELVSHLVYSEVVATLGLLQIHGSAVIKAYALHTHHSVSVLALLSMCFKTVRAGATPRRLCIHQVPPAAILERDISRGNLVYMCFG